jgi:hypothetical protein
MSGLVPATRLLKLRVFKVVDGRDKPAMTRRTWPAGSSA